MLAHVSTMRFSGSGGFAILEAASREEAIALAKKFLDVVGEGECEIRQLFVAPEGAMPDPATHRAHLAEQYVKS